MDYITQLLFLCPTIFLAGFIDSVAGGGGIISLPAYIFAGIPPHMALGCNKFSSSVGTTFSAARYFLHGALDLKVALLSAAGAFIGSAIGSRIALYLDEQVLKVLLLVMLPVAASTMLLKKGSRENDTPSTFSKQAVVMLSIAIGFLIGGYDGLFGPGTGTFAILAYTVLLKYDFKTASGNAKALNLASNYAAVITFISAGTVLYKIAIPVALCGVVGNVIGSGLAIKKGARLIRPMLIFVFGLIFIKIMFDVIF